jgi:hypothetical protein
MKKIFLEMRFLPDRNMMQAIIKRVTEMKENDIISLEKFH